MSAFNQRDINDIICHIDMSGNEGGLDDKIANVWGKYVAYHIFNVPNTDYVKLYEELAEELGDVRVCHSVNDKKTQFSKSRDIKPNSDLYHYFASTTRQPLHTDYAYYESSEAPDWLMLYCIKPSELGGQTHLLSTKTLESILKKYNPELLEKIKINVTWRYNGNDGDKTHQKPIYDGKFINWNYWQIKGELNDPSVMKVRQEFFEFLEKVIVDGNIYDFSKTWNTGDCVIFNDHLTLHGRDAFLGNERWLKDHAFYNKD
jgi:alpha-ketoglutarate-dependent taurine dioxygenase